jgi:hypothetical protein
MLRHGPCFGDVVALGEQRGRPQIDPWISA